MPPSLAPPSLAPPSHPRRRSTSHTPTARLPGTSSLTWSLIRLHFAMLPLPERKRLIRLVPGGDLRKELTGGELGDLLREFGGGGVGEGDGKIAGKTKGNGKGKRKLIPKTLKEKWEVARRDERVLAKAMEAFGREFPGFCAQGVQEVGVASAGSVISGAGVAGTPSLSWEDLSMFRFRKSAVVGVDIANVEAEAEADTAAAGDSLVDEDTHVGDDGAFSGMGTKDQERGYGGGGGGGNSSHLETDRRRIANDDAAELDHQTPVTARQAQGKRAITRSTNPVLTAQGLQGKTQHVKVTLNDNGGNTDRSAAQTRGEDGHTVEIGSSSSSSVDGDEPLMNHATQSVNARGVYNQSKRPQTNSRGHGGQRQSHLNVGPSDRRVLFDPETVMPSIEGFDIDFAANDDGYGGGGGSGPQSEHDEDGGDIDFLQYDDHVGGAGGDEFEDIRFNQTGHIRSPGTESLNNMYQPPSPTSSASSSSPSATNLPPSSMGGVEWRGGRSNANVNKNGNANATDTTYINTGKHQGPSNTRQPSVIEQTRTRPAPQEKPRSHEHGVEHVDLQGRHPHTQLPPRLVAETPLPNERVQGQWRAQNFQTLPKQMQGRVPGQAQADVQEDEEEKAKEEYRRNLQTQTPSRISHPQKQKCLLPPVPTTTTGLNSTKSKASAITKAKARFVSNAASQLPLPSPSPLLVHGQEQEQERARRRGIKQGDAKVKVGACARAQVEGEEDETQALSQRMRSGTRGSGQAQGETNNHARAHLHPSLPAQTLLSLPLHLPKHLSTPISYAHARTPSLPHPLPITSTASTSIPTRLPLTTSHLPSTTTPDPYHPDRNPPETGTGNAETNTHPRTPATIIQQTLEASQKALHVLDDWQTRYTMWENTYGAELRSLEWEVKGVLEDAGDVG